MGMDPGEAEGPQNFPPGPLFYSLFITLTHPSLLTYSVPPTYCLFQSHHYESNYASLSHTSSPSLAPFCPQDLSFQIFVFKTIRAFSRISSSPWGFFPSEGTFKTRYSSSVCCLVLPDQTPGRKSVDHSCPRNPAIRSWCP